MKIAIIGTRGIPNNYGGFEQLAEHLSLGLKNHGNEVYVYNSSHHIYKEKEWNGINIIHINDPEKTIGTAGQFIYDLGCILDARKHSFDVILNLGYTSSSVWMKLLPRNSRIITNMDGLEWKRTKYNKLTQKFLKYAEKLAVRGSDVLVADSVAIKAYLEKTYHAGSEYIAYGADLFTDPDETVLESFKAGKYGYNMLIARMEPENNIEMILDGVVKSQSQRPFFIVGNTENKFGKYLRNKFKDDRRIIFTGPIYKHKTINNLRYFSNLYFHGHSVGGTNPSLLEAMACSCLIGSHNNEFNRGVLGGDAYYFQNPGEVAAILDQKIKTSSEATEFVRSNFEKVRTHFSWEKIVNDYERIMTT
jgi:glycosyltransferase involved in cell wall biosynthesis